MFTGSESRANRRVAIALAFVGGLVAAAPARANTYQFSFTTSSLVSAIQTAYGAAYNTDGFYAFFIQVESPNGSNGCANANGCVINSNQNNITSAPNTNGTDPWTDSNYVYDPSDLGAGSWMEFGKVANQQFVSLLIPAAGSVYNACNTANSSGCPFSGGGTPPYGFGNYNGGTAFINSAFNSTNSFTFTIGTPYLTTLNTGVAYNLLVDAEYISPGGSTYSSLSAKMNNATQFNLLGTGGTPTQTAIPEPGPVVTMAFGLGLLSVIVIRRRRVRSQTLSAS